MQGPRRRHPQAPCRSLGCALGLAGSLLAACGDVGGGSGPPAGATAVSTERPIEVSPSALAAAYDASHTDADAQYKRRKLRVTGEVEAIQADADGTPLVALSAGERFGRVTFHGLSQEEASKLQPGQTVTLECRGAGLVLRTPVLAECILK